MNDNKFNDINLTESDIDFLRNDVKKWYTDKRYAHVLSTEKEVAELGQILLPDKVNSLRAAALLHDITKKYDYEKQLQYCNDFGIILSNPIIPNILHAVTGAAVAEREYSRYVDEEILSGIRWHTNGKPGMSVFEEIIFLADYIEPGRAYTSCADVRKMVHDELDFAKSYEENVIALKRGVLAALDSTIVFLISKNVIIDINSVAARNYYLNGKNF